MKESDKPPSKLNANKKLGSSKLLSKFQVSFLLKLLVGTIILIGTYLYKVPPSIGLQSDAIPQLNWEASIGIILVIVINLLFVAAETAIECLRPVHLKVLKDESTEGSLQHLTNLIEKRSQFVAATTIGNQAARFLLVLLSLEVGTQLNSFFSRFPNLTTVMILSTACIAVPLLIVNMIVELVPRSYATLHPIRVGLRLYKFIEICAALFSLPAFLVTKLAGLLTNRFGGTASFVLPNQAEEEIRTLVEDAQESGEIEDEEREMLHSVFEFGDTVVREVMTPRVDIDALPITSTPEAVLALIRESGHSRIPLYEKTDDEIIGIVHAKDLLMTMLSSGSLSLASLMRRPMFVPENKNLHDLLTEMRSTRNQMAVVQDEFGGTSGIVTIEDIVEEIVGDIVDEYDNEEPEIVEAAGGWLVDGRTHIDDVMRQVGADFDCEEFDTIGGFVFGLFGRQPSLGESIEQDGCRFLIAETDGRRILRLRIEKIESETSAEVL